MFGGLSDASLPARGRKDTHKASDVRAILARLAAMAERTGCAVVTILHLNKNSKEGNALYRFDAQSANRALELIGRHVSVQSWRDRLEVKGEVSLMDRIIAGRRRDRSTTAF